MTQRFALSMIGILALAGNAQASNSTIEDALKSRDDLSTFYRALVDTGVAGELEEGASYTVFAPTNEAFAKLSQERYPCFHAPECKRDLAEVLRNHIVPGERHLGDVAKGNGGLHSISKTFISVGQPTRDNFVVGGKQVIRSSGLFGSLLYKLDGVIATPLELSRFERMPYPPQPQEAVTEAAPAPAETDAQPADPVLLPAR
jgi:uncharacterized surface protein with fasciclin (FAS1) repeats